MKSRSKTNLGIYFGSSSTMILVFLFSLLSKSFQMLILLKHQCSHLAQLQPHFTTTNVRQNVETQQMMPESVLAVYKRMFHQNVLTQVVAIWMAARIGAKFVSIRPTLLYYLASIKVEPQTSWIASSQSYQVENVRTVCAGQCVKLEWKVSVIIVSLNW